MRSVGIELHKLKFYKVHILMTVFVFLAFPALTFGYFNIGLGYSFGAVNNYMIRLGYETLEPPAFAILADYVFNVRWDISLKLLLAVTEGLLVGPGISLVRPLAQNEIRTDIEALVSLKLNSFLQVTAGVPVTRLSASITDILFVGVRFFVPDPPGYRMRDKLYVDFNYSGQNMKLLVGLLEP